MVQSCKMGCPASSWFPWRGNDFKMTFRLEEDPKPETLSQSKTKKRKKEKGKGSWALWTKIDQSAAFQLDSALVGLVPAAARAE